MNSFDMYIVCACDDGYSVHCGALITSIFENHTHCRIEVFVLTDSISDDNRAKFGLLADRYHQRIDIIAIDKSLFRNLPFGGKFDNISLATYYRLLVASVLPDNLDKVLYLDCDIIVKADLMPLWNIDLNRFAFAAVEDALPHSVEAPKRLDYSALERYYNCGVLLMKICMSLGDFDRAIEIGKEIVAIHPLMTERFTANQSKSGTNLMHDLHSVEAKLDASALLGCAYEKAAGSGLLLLHARAEPGRLHRGRQVRHAR